MSIRYHVKFIRFIVLGCFLLFPSSIVAVVSVDESQDWNISVEGESALMSCTLQNNEANPWDIIADVNKTDGICELVDNAIGKSTGFRRILNAIDRIGSFIEDYQNGFDLGGYARCKVNTNLPKIETTSLGELCRKLEDNITITPIATMVANSVDASGIFKVGLEQDALPKKTQERKYIGGMTGLELFGKNQKNTDKNGLLLSEAESNVSGSTAQALRKFDKATTVLKTLAAKMTGSTDLSAFKLPFNKSAAMDIEDEAVQLTQRMGADLNAFSDTLSRKLIAYTTDSSKILKVAKKKRYKHKPPKPESITAVNQLSLAEYENIEQNLTAEFFKDGNSSIADVYKAIEYEAKAKYASEQLLMSMDPNYIADPSEARLSLVKDSHKNAFKYAAMIQLEKNKQLKMKIANEVRRKKQMVDIIKQQAYIKASRFRDDIATHMLKHLLNKVDQSIQ